jgi:hypothetical protein
MANLLEDITGTVGTQKILVQNFLAQRRIYNG